MAENAPHQTEFEQNRGDLTGAHDAIVRAAAAAPVEGECNPLLTMLNAMLREARAQAWDEGYDEGLDFETHSAQDREWPARTPNPYRPTSPESKRGL